MKIVVVGPSWVGDMCMAQVLFKMLKMQYPDAHIDVLAPKWSEALLLRMPEVSEALTLPFGHGAFQFRERVAFGKSLKNRSYNWAIVLPNSWKSAVIPWAAKIPKRTGWLGELRCGLLNDYKKLDKAAFPLMIQRFAALTDLNQSAYAREELPIPELQKNDSSCAALVQAFSLNLDRPVLALCPGAEYGATKMWPAEYFAEIAQAYLRKNWQVWVLGSPNDQAIAECIREALSFNPGDEVHFVNLVGKTQLADAVDLLALASAVIANDSGLMHIASALDRKAVAIYGSTSPQFTPPLGRYVGVVREEGLYCSPCFKRECKEKHLRCLKDIKPEKVMHALNALGVESST